MKVKKQWLGGNTAALIYRKKKKGFFMKILKRSGAEAVFDINKIIAAVTKANQTVDLKNTLTAEQIQAIGKYVEGVCAALDRALSVEEIQDIVETQIMKAGAFEVAKKYITYRYVRSLVRQANSTDKQILTLIECNNEDIKQENSNKNPTVNSGGRSFKRHCFQNPAPARNCRRTQRRHNPLPRYGLLRAAHAQLRLGKP